MVELIFWSLFLVAWASYGMYVIKAYIRTHAKSGKEEKLIGGE